LAKNYTEKLIPQLHAIVDLIFEVERKWVDEIKNYGRRLGKAHARKEAHLVHI